MDAYDARCRPDQVEACRSAVRSDSLSTFDNGGSCEPRAYDIYDHLCTLNYYTSGVDYCCCAHERNALCCRFYYDHNYFRCDQEEDYINVPPSLTTILIISGVVFVIFLLIVIAFIFKCMKARRASGHQSCCYTGNSGNKANQDSDTQETDSLTGSSSRANQAAETGNNKPDTVASHGTPEDVPLVNFAGLRTRTHNVDETNNNEGRPQPSAPPATAEDSDNIPVPPPYHRAASEPAMPVIPEPLHGPDHPMFRLDSEHEPRDRLLSVPEAPPAYDEHHRDPRYHPEMDGNQDTRNFY